MYYVSSNPGVLIAVAAECRMIVYIAKGGAMGADGPRRGNGGQGPTINVEPSNKNATNYSNQPIKRAAPS